MHIGVNAESLTTNSIYPWIGIIDAALLPMARLRPQCYSVIHTFATKVWPDVYVRRWG